MLQKTHTHAHALTDANPHAEAPLVAVTKQLPDLLVGQMFVVPHHGNLAILLFEFGDGLLHKIRHEYL